MHSLGTTTVSRAVSIALRTTANITVATNNPVPVTWGARDGTYENRRFTHSLGGFTVTVGKKGRYKFSIKLNGRMTGSSLSTQNRTDSVVAFIAINNQSVSRSVMYAAPYQQSGGYFTITGEIDEVSLNAGDFVALYVYRLITTGTVVITGNESSMTIEQTAEEK